MITFTPERVVNPGLPVVIGSVLYAVLPGLEFAHIAAHETGADMEAAQAALKEWFLVFLVGGSLVFLLVSRE